MITLEIPYQVCKRDRCDLNMTLNGDHSIFVVMNIVIQIRIYDCLDLHIIMEQRNPLTTAVYTPNGIKNKYHFILFLSKITLI